jgi:putative tryptophan/tyrosine transport system substrate-binding protein
MLPPKLGADMQRRTFIKLLGCAAAALPLTARTQQPKVWRIGLLAPTPPTPTMLSAFRDGLRQRGYIEGQDLFIDVGFVASLARPSGNITGVSIISTDLAGKQVELLIETVPGVNHVGVVANLKNPNLATQLREVEKVINALGLQLEVVEASVPDEFDRAFARLSANGVKGVVLLADSSTIEHRRRIARLAQEARLPTAFQRRENVEAGGLLSYGPSLDGQFREAASYVDRLLKGAKPADLPVEQPTKFELVINLKTAKALGLTIPPTLLARADEVLE